MTKDNFVRIKHMIDAAQTICGFLERKQLQDLQDDDPMLFSALARQLEIFGEAAAGVSQEFRTQYPHIPWKKIVGMRNKLIHAYFDVDPDIVWQAATVEIPKVVPDLKNIILPQA